MWLLSVGVLIPQSKDVLDTDKSFKPDSTNLITSFLFEAGLIKFGLLLYKSSNLLDHSESLKKYDFSVIHSTGPPVTVLKEPSFCFTKSFSL